MSDIAKRLKEERLRAGLNQENFGKLCCASKRTVFDWESGKTSPTLLQISALANEGIDQVYVLTGQRQVNAYCSGSSESLKVSEVCAQSMNESYREGFSQEERILLENFRSLSEEDRRAIRRQSDVFAELNRMIKQRQDKKVG